MKKIKPFLLIVVIILVGVLLAGCIKEAPAEEHTADETAIFSTPPFDVESEQPTSNPLDIIVSSTQTAQAMASPTPTEVPPATATSVPEEPAEEETTEAEAQEPTAVPTVVSVGRPATYTLEMGEWVICIARRYDLDLTAFLNLNNLTMEDRPGFGTELKIPQEGNWKPDDYGPRTLTKHPATHTVTAGQTLYTVACHYGDVTPEEIIAANGLTEPYTLKTGQVLEIP